MSEVLLAVVSAILPFLGAAACALLAARARHVRAEAERVEIEVYFMKQDLPR